MKATGLALACAFCSVALAAPPAAPELSVQITDIRQLEFRYEPLPAVARYELWFRTRPGAQAIKYKERAAQRAPLFRISVPVHLLDWKQSRYYVNACNRSGCTPSNEVGVDGLQLPAIGFVKPGLARSNRYFGSNVVASADGKTFAALSSDSVGVVNFTATVHVYRKTTSSSGWRRETRLVPSTVQSDTAASFFGDPLAISGDGNLLVLGTPSESFSGADFAGAVYVFRRSGSTWTQTQKLSTGTPDDNFGSVVKVDDAGRTLVISHRYPTDRYEPGTLQVYRDAENDGSDQFVLSTSVPVPPNQTDPLDTLGCQPIALSGNGQTLLRGCSGGRSGNGFVQVLNTPGWTESARLETGPVYGIETNCEGTTALVEREASAFAWKLGAAGWEFEDRLRAINPGIDYGRRHIALSRDGKIAALGTATEFTLGVGPVYPPYLAGDPNHPNGGVVIFERKPSGWVLRRLVKPDSTHQEFAGHSVAFGDNGRLLIVGAPTDPSAATGINGDRDDDSGIQRGAVWVY